MKCPSHKDGLICLIFDTWTEAWCCQFWVIPHTLQLLPDSSLYKLSSQTDLTFLLIILNSIIIIIILGLRSFTLHYTNKERCFFVCLCTALAWETLLMNTEVKVSIHWWDWLINFHRFICSSYFINLFFTYLDFIQSFIHIFSLYVWFGPP